MAYCTITDLEKVAEVSFLLRLADDSGSASDLTGAEVQAAISEAMAQADAEIDTYLATRYTLPLATVPAIITRLSARMTVYYLTLRRQARDEKWEGVYKRAVIMLEQMAAGKISLGIPTTKPDSPERPKPCMVGINSKFSRWRGF